jgi:hypothetical protein
MVVTHMCTQLVFAYDNMYTDNIYNIDLYFIHLHFFTKVAHGDTWHPKIISIFIIINILIIS